MWKIVLCSTLAAGLAPPVAGQTRHAFESEDGVAVTGYGWAPRSPVRAVIVAFHQGGANARGEYEPIVPRLTARGFQVLGVDARTGGERFGYGNLTAAAVDGTPSYCDAARDVAAAVDFARSRWPGRPLVLWGSSFSGALVLREAADRGTNVAAVLAFSPAAGGPMAGCRGEDRSAAIRVPVLVLRPAGELEVTGVPDQLATFERQGHTVYVAEPGTHGSSMLVESRVEGDTEATWSVVLEFLEHALGGESAVPDERAFP